MIFDNESIDAPLGIGFGIIDRDLQRRAKAFP